MKKDKELLILAAKAACFNVKAVSVDTDDNFDGLVIGAKNTKQKVWWNPILNDGDALRLAVYLRVSLSFHMENDNEDVKAWVNGSYHAWSQQIEQDPLCATRRAIVRAAAAIGEQM